MSQLRDQQAELDRLHIKPKIVTFDDDFMAKAYVESSKLEWPLLLDQESRTYHAYQLTRANWWTLYNPISILKYLWLIASGTRPGKPGKDWNQLGGDVLISPDGIVRLHHQSQTPHDRPSVESILNLVKSATND